MLENNWKMNIVLSITTNYYFCTRLISAQIPACTSSATISPKQLQIVIKNLFTIRDFNFSLNFRNISLGGRREAEFAYSAVKFTSQTMPYYGTMEMSLHCCGAGVDEASQRSHVTGLGLKGRPSWFTARTCGCACLNENYTRAPLYGGATFPS